MNRELPFDSIESAHEFVALVASAHFLLNEVLGHASPWEFRH